MLTYAVIAFIANVSCLTENLLFSFLKDVMADAIQNEKTKSVLHF